MLSMIKGIINQKKDFLEAAEMILESEMNNLDDIIILNEEAALPDEPVIEEDEPELDDTKNDSEESDEKKPEEDDTDIVDQPINDEPVSSDSDDGDIMDASLGDDIEDIPTPTEEPSNEPIEEPIEEPMPIPGNDELPEPVSNITGEPVADDNILSMELDLGSNTPKDILPIPPASAGDAVVSDDIMDQRIDSGFGGESTEEFDEAGKRIQKKWNSRIRDREMVIREFISKSRQIIKNKNISDEDRKELEEIIEVVETELNEYPNNFIIRKNGDIIDSEGNNVGNIKSLSYKKLRKEKKIASKILDIARTSSNGDDAFFDILNCCFAESVDFDEDIADMLIESDDPIDEGADLTDRNRKETFGFLADQEEIRRLEDENANMEKKKAENEAKRLEILKRIEEEKAKKMKGESADILSEAITIADTPEGEGKPAEAAPTEAPAADTSTDVPVDDTSATEEPAPDNDVTAAVKDKVAEAETPTETSPASKEELMKKLSTLTKGLEDAKSLIMKSI